MAFKVQRVAKVKPPSVLGSTNPESQVNNERCQRSQSKEGFRKPPLPGKPHSVVNSNFQEIVPKSGTALNNNHNENKRQQPSAYCYAGVEFRPLLVTDEGAVSTAIIPQTKGNPSTHAVKPNDETLTYEDVDVPTGDFDRINLNSYSRTVNQNSGDYMNDSTSDMHNSSHGSHPPARKPPPIPKPYSKSKDGVDGPDGGKRRTPPPLPKPYSSRKEEKEESNPPQEELVMDAVYAVVNKSSKPKIPLEKKDENSEDEGEPPPLPIRPDFESQEDVKKSHESITSHDSREGTEKSAKGLGLIKTFKKHIRQLSDDSGPAKKTDEQKGSTTEEISKDRKQEVKAYLVTDIVNQPSTKMFGEPEMYESVSDVRDEVDLSSDSSDLPEGWQEVKDAGGTYYWHIASGTTQWEKPQKVENAPDTAGHRSNGDQSKPKSKPELKTVTSFPVHSMGWIELEESQVAPHNMSDTIAECISNLAQQRKDLWKTTETWGNGKDLRLLLESDNLKLVDVQSKATLLVQPVSKMRVWGAGREEQKDFAYVARDQTTGKHKCHVFRCHGPISGRAIHNKLHEMCNKILAEKKKARENQQPAAGATKQWSDILNTPPKPSVKDQAGFNVKPVTEMKKSFSAKYVGKVNVPKPSGIEILHKAVDFASNVADPSKWRTCLIDITVSSVRCTDCQSQQVLAEDRIKFVSFIGVAKDVRLCGYITSSDRSSPFICHVFHCIPNAASFTRALEEACRLRLQSCIDTHPELAQKLTAAEADKASEKEAKPTTGIKGLFGKLTNQTKLGVKRTNSDTASSIDSQTSTSHFLIKYCGSQPVSVGTGLNAIKEAVKASQGAIVQVINLTVGHEGIFLDDSVKSGLSRKHIASDKVSYCGVASDRVHFGVIESKGGGKFICHVFAEYKIPVNTVVDAINRTLL